MNKEIIAILIFLVTLSVAKLWFDKKSENRNNLGVALSIFVITAFWIGYLTDALMTEFSTLKVVLIFLFTYGLIENYFKRIKNHEVKI